MSGEQKIIPFKNNKTGSSDPFSSPKFVILLPEKTGSSNIETDREKDDR